MSELKKAIFDDCNFSVEITLKVVTYHAKCRVECRL